MVKRINRNDAEENEEGLDKDLEGFVVQEQEEGDEQAMLDKANADRLQDDKKETARLYREIILGQNRKRKRGEMEQSDDELSERALRIRQERENQSDLSDDGEGWKRQKITK